MVEGEHEHSASFRHVGYLQLMFHKRKRARCCGKSYDSNKKVLSSFLNILAQPCTLHIKEELFKLVCNYIFSCALAFDCEARRLESHRVFTHDSCYLQGRCSRMM